MATIDRHGATWRVRYVVDGTRRTRSGFPTRTAARAFLSQTEVDLTRGVHVDPRAGHVLFRDYALLWLEDSQVEETTKDRTRSRLTAQVLPTFGQLKLGDVRRERVRSWVTALSKEYSPSYVRSCLVTLRSVLAQAVDDGRLATNPAAGVSAPPARRDEKRFLTLAEVERLADEMHPRFRALVVLAALSGMRWGELAGLPLASVDMLRGRVSVSQVLARGEKGRRLLKSYPKNDSSRRTIALPKAAVEELGVHLAQHHDGQNALVFTAEQGGLILHAWWNKQHFAPAVARARLEVPSAPTFHSLRHTHAALLIGQGVHPKALQRRLGHSSIRTTLDTYGHLYEEHETDIVDGLDRAMLELRRGARSTG